MVDRERLLESRLHNRLQSLLLLTSSVTIAGVLAWVLGGLDFVWLTLLGVVLLFAMAPRLSPWLVLRLYRVRPIRESEVPVLFELIGALARRAGLTSAPRLVYIPSEVPNAFAVGSSSDGAIALSDGLLRRLDLQQVAGVLAHEISHLRHGDTQVMGLADVVSRVTGALAAFGQLLLLLNLPLLLLGYAQASWAAVAVLILAPVLSALVQLALSRTREFQADLGAAELLGSPEPMIAALLTLEGWHRRFLARVLWRREREPSPSILRTHPPSEERIARLVSLRPAAPAGPSVRIPASPRPALPATPPRPRWHVSGLWY